MTQNQLLLLSINTNSVSSAKHLYLIQLFYFRVDEDFRIKVADATLSRDIYELEYYKPGEKARALPVKWMSPEALEHELFTSKGDVVSRLRFIGLSYR